MTISKRNAHAVPIVLSNGEVQVSGGLSIREYVAIELLSALLSNPGCVGVLGGDVDRLRAVALAQTDHLLADFGDKPPELIGREPLPLRVVPTLPPDTL